MHVRKRWADIPLLFKEGWLRSSRGGYERTAKRTLFCCTNRPVCAAKEASRHYLVAQPPRLGKAGNGLRFIPPLGS